MNILHGKSISKGIAIGTLYYYSKEQQQVSRRKVEDAQKEVVRFREAKNKAILELQVLYEKALSEVGELHADIFQVHQMMLEDEDYNEAIENKILVQLVNAEYAVASTGDRFSELFSKMEDSYFQERALDVKDISERVVSILLKNDTKEKIPPIPSIVVAKELVPSETVQMDKENLLGFITEVGSNNSHTAILARTMGIPAVSGIVLEEKWNGAQVGIDGEEGIVYINPDKKEFQRLQEKQRELLQQKELLLHYKGKETCTKQGKKIRLYANVGNFSDIGNALKHDAEGVGLFRSEFLYLEKEQMPTEEEQFQIYRMAAESMAGKLLIIRTLDIGADKKVEYLGLEQEENPALGYRAIRICLREPELFKTQLRAILRASAFGNVAIMYPMIISADEVSQIKKIMESVKEELKGQGVPFQEIEQGIMIETPAAAMISEDLAKEVDFFSIGTNDLSQYVLAIDRQNEKLEELYDSHHPAILKMIQNIVENGHRFGCWVGICGELGADLSMTKQFVEMGVDELSVSPNMILPLRKRICELE